MPTTAEMKRLKQWLRSQGYVVELIERRQRVQWYKANGTPLPRQGPLTPTTVDRQQ